MSFAPANNNLWEEEEYDEDEENVPRQLRFRNFVNQTTRCHLFLIIKARLETIILLLNKDIYRVWLSLLRPFSGFTTNHNNNNVVVTTYVQESANLSQILFCVELFRYKYGLNLVM